jgi:putative transposase
LGVNRSNYYYEPAKESSENLALMEVIDEEYTKHPFYGSRQITWVLRNEGYSINRKRVQRLMRMIGLEAIYPKKNLSKGMEVEKKYPYLLNGMTIEVCNQVWSTDITYIRLSGGFLYLVALLDWYSRYVIAWRISNSMDIVFCLDAAEEALTLGTPEIINSDQGSQFTSPKFTELFESKGVKISWDGKGRALDNIFMERFWRSLKYEEVYLKEYKNVNEAVKGIGAYMNFYNTERPHQSLDGKRPKEVFFGSYRPNKNIEMK